MIEVHCIEDIKVMARDYAESCAECERLGHSLAPGESLAQKIRNLCAIIQSQRELMVDDIEAAQHYENHGGAE